MIRTMHNDQRLSQCRRIAGIKGRVPLLVFFAKADNDDISIGDAFSCADGIQARALVVVPELVRLSAHDLNTAVITCLMVSNWPRKHNIKVASAGVSPLTVIRLARKWGYEGYTDF
jgi:hypothetical protein